jgi:hypothetical protein
MTGQNSKPKGTFARLMSNSPLQEVQGQVEKKPENLKPGNPEIRESGKPENLKTGIQENRETRKPEILKSGNRDVLKSTKYSTQLHPDLVKRLKQYALAIDVKDYEVVEDAITEYLEKRQV